MIDEADRYRQFNHRNIIRLITSFPCTKRSYRGSPCMIFPLAEGEDLAKFMTRYYPNISPPLDVIRHILRQIVDALVHVHGTGFVH
jgi:serine/threonine protein kinase